MGNIISLYKQEEEKSKYSSPIKSHKRRISEENWEVGPENSIHNNEDLIREIK